MMLKASKKSGSTIPRKYYASPLTITTQTEVDDYTQAQETTVLADPKWIIPEKPWLACVL